MTAITYQELFDYDASGDLREWWIDTYGPDAVVEIDKALSDCKRDDWVVWLAGKRHPALGFVWAGMAMRWAGIAAYADNVTEENWREARSTAVVAADSAAAHAAVAASVAADSPITAFYAATDASARRSYADAWAEMCTVAEAWLRAGGRP